MATQLKIQPIANSVTRLELPAHTLPPFTHTNSYVVASQGEAVLIDPGFYEERALELVTQTLAGNSFNAIILTHTHPDHVEGIELIHGHYPNAPIFVHDKEINKVLQHGNVTRLNPEEPFYVGGLELVPVFTPGHSPGHLSFYLPDSKLALVGDMVAGFSSIWIGKPDGNIHDYFESLEKLRRLELVAFAPGHGDVITEPYKKLAEVKEHRLQRLEQVRAALQNKPLSLAQLRDIVYLDVPAPLMLLAEQSLLALLDYLEQTKRVRREGEYWLLANI
jgi:endoribonuclease LACTB2